MKYQEKKTNNVLSPWFWFDLQVDQMGVILNIPHVAKGTTNRIMQGMLRAFYINHRGHRLQTRYWHPLFYVTTVIVVHCQSDERCLFSLYPFLFLSHFSNPINWRRGFRLERCFVEHCLDQWLSNFLNCNSH